MSWIDNVHEYSKSKKVQKQSMLLEDWLSGEEHTYMLAGMLGGGTYYPLVGWTTWNGPTYISAGMLGVCIYFMAVGWHTWSMGILSTCQLDCWKWAHISWMACLEHAYILWLSAGLIVVGTNICWLEHLECTYIIHLSAGPLIVGEHMC